MQLRAQQKPIRAWPMINLHRRNRSTEYRLGYLRARTEMSYKAMKRPNKTFHFGLLTFHPDFVLNVFLLSADQE